MIVWKEIPGFEGFYEISSFGGIRRIIGNSGNTRYRMRKPCSDKDGYSIMVLSKNNVMRCIKIHRIVLEVFVGMCPAGMESRHKDGNKTNNSIDNLEWSTHADNIHDKIKHGTLLSGNTHPRSKITSHDVKRIREMYGSGVYSQYDIAKMFNIRQGHVSRIILNQRWKTTI